MPGVRPSATSSSSASTVEPSSSASENGPSRATRVAEAPSRTSTPSSRSDVEHLLARERLLALDQPLAAVDERHARAERAPRLRHLDADDAAAEDGEARGHAFAVVASLFVHGRASRRPGMSGMSGRRAGRDHDRAARDERLLSLDGDAALAGERPRPRTSVTPCFSSHGSCAAVVEIVDHLVAARSTAAASIGEASRPARAAPRCASSTGRSSAFDGMQA